MKIVPARAEGFPLGKGPPFRRDSYGTGQGSRWDKMEIAKEESEWLMNQLAPTGF